MVFPKCKCKYGFSKSSKLIKRFLIEENANMVFPKCKCKYGFSKSFKLIKRFLIEENANMVFPKCKCKYGLSKSVKLIERFFIEENANGDAANGVSGKAVSHHSEAVSVVNEFHVSKSGFLF